MAEETDVAETAKPAKSGGIVSKLANAIGILVLVIAGNLIASLVVRDFLPELATRVAPQAAAADGVMTGPAPAEASGPPIYLALDPPLVASIDDGQAIRFVQITIEVMARDQATLDAVKAHTPVIRNNLLMLLGRKLISDLTSSEGKELLRQEALQEMRSILIKMEPGKRGQSLAPLQELYFTSFVVQ